MNLLIENLIKIGCINRNRRYYRSPNNYEVSEGVPEWFHVYVTNHFVEYITQNGRRFQSISEVNEWRMYGPFEEMEKDIPSF